MNKNIIIIDKCLENKKHELMEEEQLEHERKEHLERERKEEELTMKQEELNEIYNEFFKDMEFKNIALFYKIGTRLTHLLIKSVHCLINKCKTTIELDELLANLNINPNTSITNEDF